MTRVIRHGDLAESSYQELHHVIEGAVVGDAEILELDGVRRAQRRRRLRFTLEPRVQFVSPLEA
jgi:hypothetical protein